MENPVNENTMDAEGQVDESLTVEEDNETCTETSSNYSGKPKIFFCNDL